MIEQFIDGEIYISINGATIGQLTSLQDKLGDMRYHSGHKLQELPMYTSVDFVLCCNDYKHIGLVCEHKNVVSIDEILNQFEISTTDIEDVFNG